MDWNRRSDYKLGVLASGINDAPPTRHVETEKRLWFPPPQRCESEPSQSSARPVHGIVPVRVALADRAVLVMNDVLGLVGKGARAADSHPFPWSRICRNSVTASSSFCHSPYFQTV
jgi:hypothetical protein